MIATAPLISVVVPFHAPQKGGRAQMLQELVDDCALLEGVECILIDDGSPVAWSPQTAPGTPVRTVRLPQNVGPGGARNVGFSLAVGEWILCVDSDDRLDGAGVPGLVRALLHCPSTVDVVTFPVASFRDGTDSAGHRHEAINRTAARMVCEPDGSLSHVVALCNKAFRRSFLEAHALHIPPLMFGEDLAFLGEVAAARPVCALWSGAPVVRIREGHESLTQDTVSVRRMEEDFRAVVWANGALYKAGLSYWRWSVARRWWALLAKAPVRALALFPLLFGDGGCGRPDQRRVMVFVRRRLARWTGRSYTPQFTNAVVVLPSIVSPVAQEDV